MPFFSPCALLYGNHEHHLDHLAPLCSLLSIPLVVTDPYIEDLAKTFYPNLSLYYMDELALGTKLTDTYNLVITCFPKSMLSALFFPKAPPLSIWCPHGLSDKGADSFYFESLKEEKGVFLYGKRTEELLLKKTIFSPSTVFFPLGSYRKYFHQKHADFYKLLMQKHLYSKLNPSVLTFLYSPTWDDAEGFCSVQEATTSLIETLPSFCQLIIKFHPNTLVKNEAWLQKLLIKYEDHPRLLFLKECPCIYALLSCIDAYIGDASSIGYDSLNSDKPLFFLKKDSCLKTLPLHSCGHIIMKEDFHDIYTTLLSSLNTFDPYIPSKLQTLDYNFYPTPNILFLKKQLETFYKNCL